MEVKLLHDNARLPQRSSLGAAGYDLYACEPGMLMPGAHGLIPTGIALAIKPGRYGRVAPRSGLAVRYGIDIHAGVIDSDYRGEVRVAAINHGGDLWEWKAGERIAQLIVERCYDDEPVAVAQLPSTNRGAGGFGSTGL